QLIPIGDFIAYATQTFGIGAPPTWIQGITLQDLSVDFNTQTKNFHFSVTGNIPLANNNSFSITLGFSMEAIAVGTGYTKTLSGTLKIGQSIFQLIFTTSPSDTSFTASWEAKGPEGYLQFEDIAHAFGFQEVPPIPDGLNLALKKAGLYYDFKVG